MFEKALGLYRKAIELDPWDFQLAADYAQCWYGMTPPKTDTAEGGLAAEQSFCDDALAAWRHAQELARDDREREGIRLHFARFEISAGRYDEARANLNAVTNSFYREARQNLLVRLARLTGEALPTNAPDAVITNAVPAAPEQKGRGSPPAT